MWVFGYGSLMWNPGIPVVSRSVARLTGYHRALCIHSTHYRGTLAHPGLVFGLDWGGVCDGVAFEVAPEHNDSVLAELRRRELIYGVYREAQVEVSLAASERRSVDAVTFIAERAHPNFAGELCAARQARIVRSARGIAGTNLAYVINTLAHIRELGLRDRHIERVGQLSSVFAMGAAKAAEGEAPRVKGLSDAWRMGHHPHHELRPRDQSRFQHRAALAAWQR